MVGGEEQIAVPQAKLVFLAVPFAQVSPIAARVAREKLGRSLPRLSERRERSGRGDDLSQREKGLLWGLFHESKAPCERVVVFCLEAPRSGAFRANALPGGSRRLAVRAVKSADCAFIGAQRKLFTEEADGLGAAFRQEGQKADQNSEEGKQAAASRDGTNGTQYSAEEIRG